MALIRYYKFPKWLKWFYPHAIWDFFDVKNLKSPAIYLTFDDGPTPKVTEWVLTELKKHNAKATFFCIGNSVKNNPETYQKVLDDGHSVGNHSMGHEKGLKTHHDLYVKSVVNAKKSIDSKLFRPPYGKCTIKQYKTLCNLGFKFVFWSYLTYDFDAQLTSKKRIKKTLNYAKNGSVIVFHDSNKAFPQLKQDLPDILESLHKKGFIFKAIKQNC